MKKYGNTDAEETNIFKMWKDSVDWPREAWIKNREK